MSTISVQILCNSLKIYSHNCRYFSQARTVLKKRLKEKKTFLGASSNTVLIFLKLYLYPIQWGSVKSAFGRASLGNISTRHIKKPYSIKKWPFNNIFNWKLTRFISCWKILWVFVNKLKWSNPCIFATWWCNLCYFKLRYIVLSL